MRRISAKSQQSDQPSCRALRSKPSPFHSKRITSPDIINRKPFFTPIVQPKLTVNTPDDKYEREADRVADAVMRMPDPLVSRHPVEEIQMKGKSPEVQRKCTECEEEEKRLQRMPLRGNDTTPFFQRKETGEGKVNQQTAVKLQSTKGGGKFLPDNTRSWMENRFGTDFSGVKIHTDSKAVQLNRDLHAKAFTHGSDIYFNRGEFTPGTNAGKRLLAHELTHVMQQGFITPYGQSSEANVLDSGVQEGKISRNSNAKQIQRDCAEDKRKCRNNLNWSDGGHWIGSGPEPDCNCDSSFSDAKAACRNRLNWSDGGHWIGSGPEPDCSLSETVEKESTLTYLFPSNQCVQQFNADRDKISTRLSTLAGVTTGLALVRLNPYVGIAAGAVVNEAIGAIPKTPIGVGYKWVRTFKIRYTRSAHPWGINRMTMGVESRVFNEDNILVHGYSGSYDVPKETFTRFGQQLISGDSRDVTISCPRGNVLSY